MRVKRVGQRIRKIDKVERLGKQVGIYKGRDVESREIRKEVNKKKVMKKGKEKRDDIE